MNQPNNEIEFDAEKHEYRVGGIITPSVSQILKANGLMDNFRHNENSLRIGTAIHKALELHDKGTLDYSKLDPRLKKCIKLWEDFKKQMGLVVTGIEKKVCVGQIYAGTIDRIATDNRNIAIIDYKSGNPQDWAALQTAAYAMAYNPTGNYKDWERYCLKIHWDLDRAIYKPYKDKNDFQNFMSMANAYHWKKNHGYLKEEVNGDNGNRVADAD